MTPYPIPVEAKKIPLMKRILVRILGAIPYYVDNDNFSRPTIIYLVYCPKHGYFFDYRHGWRGYFECLGCRAEHEKVGRRLGGVEAETVNL